MKMKSNCEGCKYREVEKVCVVCMAESKKQASKASTLPQERLKPKRQSKYRNRVFERNDEKYRSEKEYNRHMALIIKVHHADISNLQREVVFELIPSVVLNGRKKPPIRYVADFVYDKNYADNSGKIVEDTKSPITKKNPVYRLKAHLMKHVYNIDIREV